MGLQENGTQEPRVVKHEDGVGKKQELKLDSMNTFSSSGNLDEASNIRLMVFKTLGIPPGFESFVNLGTGHLESVQTSTVGISGDVDNKVNLETVQTTTVSVSGKADNVGNLELVQTAAVSAPGKVENVGNLVPLQTAAVSASGKVDNFGKLEPEQTTGVSASGEDDNVDNLEPVQTAAVSASSKVDNIGNLEPVQTAAVSASDEVDNVSNLESVQTAAVCASGNVDNEGNLESVPTTSVSGISGNVDNDHLGSSGKLRRQKAKLIVPVTSSRSLRSKSLEKPKVPEPNDIIKEVSAEGDKKKVRKKQPPNKNSGNEYLSMKTQLRYLLHRITYEQSLIDAYSAEGWKGQSLEKLKPEKELQRAKSHILHYKLKIRALFQRLDTSLTVGKLPATLFDSEGEIDSEDIFCAKCGSEDVSLDNDIILCDGACERGFHQYCLDPPLLKEDIPPGDEGWLCPGCDCKVDCIDRLKDIQGTKVSITDSWEKIFPEAAAVASGEKPDDISGFPSDDSEDDDYDPDKPETANKVEGDLTCHNNEKYLNLPSEDSEDDDFNPSAVGQDKLVKQDSSSSDFTSDSEDLGAILEDESIPDNGPGEVPPFSDCGQPSADSGEEKGRLDMMKRPSMKDELSFLKESSEPISGRRHVERLDYKKLHDETYGNSSSDSSDEDFENSITTQKRRKTNPERTVVETSISTSNATNDESQKETELAPKRSSNRISDGRKNGPDEVVKADTSNKKSANRRLGEAVTQVETPKEIPATKSTSTANGESQKETVHTPKRTSNRISDGKKHMSAEVGKADTGNKKTANKRLVEAVIQVETPKETPVTKSIGTTSDESKKETEDTPKRTSNRTSNGRRNGSGEVGKADTNNKKLANRRLGEAVTQGTYGNSSSDPIDEDFDKSTTTQKRRKTNPEKTVVEETPKETPTSKSTNTTNDESQEVTEHMPKRTSNRRSDGRGSAEVGKADSSNKNVANRRLGEAVTQRLYASFSENQYPDRATKENLANELGLKFQQVDKWFGNARWSFNHKPQTEVNSAGNHHKGNADTGKSVSQQELNAIPADNPTRQLAVETLATSSTSAGDSSNSKSRKRKAKSNEALKDKMVTDEAQNQKAVSDKAQNQKAVSNKAQNQKVKVDMKSPQVSNSTRRTRSSRSVA